MSSIYKEYTTRFRYKIRYFYVSSFVKQFERSSVFPPTLYSNSCSIWGISRETVVVFCHYSSIFSPCSVGQDDKIALRYCFSRLATNLLLPCLCSLALDPHCRVREYAVSFLFPNIPRCAKPALLAALIPCPYRSKSVQAKMQNHLS